MKGNFNKPYLHDQLKPFYVNAIVLNCNKFKLNCKVLSGNFVWEIHRQKTNPKRILIQHRITEANVQHLNFRIAWKEIKQPVSMFSGPLPSVRNGFEMKNLDYKHLCSFSTDSVICTLFAKAIELHARCWEQCYYALEQISNANLCSLTWP